jgi:hypothetical protein
VGSALKDQIAALPIRVVFFLELKKRLVAVDPVEVLKEVFHDTVTRLG